jgi:hypothetical protein
VRSWEEEVQVRNGESTRIEARPVRVPPYGLVTARAERVTSNGVEDVDGAAVYVDGAHAGVTPLDLKLDPGPHSVRIGAPDTPSPVHLLEVQAGGRFYATTTFGRPSEPAVDAPLPRTVSLATPPALTVALAFDVPLPVREMTLHRRIGPKGAFESIDIPLRNVEGRAQGSLPFPTAGLAAGEKVTCYVTIETREGEEYASEMRTVTVTP